MNMKVIESDSEILESKDLSDNDICDEEVLENVFNLKCDEITNKLVNKTKYVLHIDGSLSSSPHIVVGLSDNTAEVYNFSNNQLAKLQSFEASESVVGVKSCVENENLFYIASKQCEIHILDLRDPNCKTSFKDTTSDVETNYKPLNCFDVASNNLLLCGGTDLHAGDAYILYWDIRNTKLLGAYWDSHTDDVTQVKFHPADANKLISGSTDGLINLYDLSKTSEDDALVDTLNTESSIEQLCWYNEQNTDMISCVTHTNDLQIWRLDDAQPYAHFHRDNIARELKRKSSEHCYIANAQVNRNSQLFILAGSNCGNGECLRAVGVDKTGLLPLFNFKTNKQRVRCGWLSKNGEILATGGENGTISIWNVETQFERSKKSNKKCIISK